MPVCATTSRDSSIINDSIKRLDLPMTFKSLLDVRGKVGKVSALRVLVIYLLVSVVAAALKRLLPPVQAIASMFLITLLLSGGVLWQHRWSRRKKPSGTTER